MIFHLTAIACVLGLVAGQLLFKLGAEAWRVQGDIFSLRFGAAFLGAIVLYACTSVAWVWVLRHMDLGRAYPWMALAFVLVPIGSYFAFGERLSVQYGVGVGLIVLGLVVATRA